MNQNTQSKLHQVDLKDLIKWQSDEKVLFASSLGAKKRLYATLRGSYEVWHNGERIYETMQPFNAVEKYNSII